MVVAATRLLDLEDFSAIVGQELSALGTGEQAGEIQHLEAVEGTHGSSYVRGVEHPSSHWPPVRPKSDSERLLVPVPLPERSEVKGC